MKFVLNEIKRELSDEEIIQDIKRASNQLGRDWISISEYRKTGKHSLNTIQNHFGTWKNALKKAGLRAERNKDEYKIIPDQMYFDDLLNVAKKTNKKTVSYEDYKKHGNFSAEHIIHRFKKWNIALIKAGLEGTGFSKDKITEQQCFDEIERIWILLGRQPTTTDFTKSKICKYSIDVFKRRFGSWRKALEAFVKYANNTDEIDQGDTPDAPELEEETKLSQHEKNKISSQNKHTTSRTINARLRFLVLQRDHFKCCACGASPAKDPSVELHVDHIIPWSKGGETVPENLQTLCSKCNLGKSDIL